MKTSEHIFLCEYVGEFANENLRAAGNGTVIGVFRHGWYLGKQDVIWLLHDINDGRIPFGIGVNGFEQKIPYDKSLEGSCFFLENEWLVVPEANLKLRLVSSIPHKVQKTIDLFALQKVSHLMVACLRKKGRGELCVLFETDGHRKGKEITYVLRAQKYIEIFRQAIYTLDVKTAEDQLENLMGLGPGLTPALDDWLVGFLYTALRVKCSEVVRDFFHYLANVVEMSALKQTHQISAAYLMAAARGMEFEALEKALFAKNEEDLDMLLSIGSSSGSDMLAGMICAVTCMQTIHSQK